MTPSEFGRWYRGLEQLAPDQAEMVARNALRKTGDTQFTVLSRMVHTLMRTAHPDVHPFEWRSLRNDIDLRLQIAETSARQEAS